jgi:PAS domain-containing protein
MINPENNELRKRIFERSPMPIVVMDAESHHFIDCNPAAVRIYGYPSKEDVIGKKPDDVSDSLQYDGSPSSTMSRWDAGHMPDGSSMKQSLRVLRRPRTSWPASPGSTTRWNPPAPGWNRNRGAASGRSMQSRFSRGSSESLKI